jgi:hypothetical protein
MKVDFRIQATRGRDVYVIRNISIVIYIYAVLKRDVSCVSQGFDTKIPSQKTVISYLCEK